MDSLDQKELENFGIQKFLKRYRIVAAVYLVLINEKNEVLLYKRNKTGFADGYYSLVAGHVEEHEGIDQAIVRETQEEIGIKIESSDFSGYSVIHRFSELGDVLDFFILCKKWQGKIKNLEPEKCSELKFFDIDNLPKTTLNYVRKGIEAAMQKKPYMVYGWCEYRK